MKKRKITSIIISLMLVIGALTAFNISVFAASNPTPAAPKITKMVVTKGDSSSGGDSLKIEANWNKATNAKKYEVKWSVSTGTGTKSGTVTTTSNSFGKYSIPVKVNTAGTATVKVRSVNGSKTSSWVTKTVKYGKGYGSWK